MAKSEMKYDYGTDSLTAEEIILKVERVVDSICNTLSDSDGDMWMSQYRELMSCGWRLHYIKKQIEETD